MAKEKEKETQPDEEFKPRGTIAILVLFAITLILLWGYIYLILIQRGVTV
ncbi:MAG: cytochrome c oxidase subunit 2A [Chloroflexota bacterium]